MIYKGEEKELKKNKRTKKLKEAGITLVALVVTIIILLILAGITLSFILGNQGLLGRAQQAHEEMRGSMVNEKVQMWKSELEVNRESGTIAQSKSITQIVDELMREGLIKENEKEIILGDDEKGVEGEYIIQIGSKIIDFYTNEYRDGTPGLYATKTNRLLKNWEELIEEGYITVSDNAITACQKDRKGDLVIAEGIEKINRDAFSNYTSLNNVEIPKTLKNIEINAFSGCANITNFIIKESIENIGMLAFKNCTGLKEIKVENQNFTIDTGNNPSFANCTGIERVVYKEGLTDIVGIGCVFANTVSIPYTAKTIKNGAFSNYKNLNEIFIPEEVKSIEHYAFRGCSNLNQIVIGKSIENIGILAFGNCTGLKEVRIKSSNFNVDVR